MTDQIRVVIADDHPVVRQGLRTLLSAYDDFCLVGEARDGEEAVRLAGAVEPDVVIMDLTMPHMDGITATKAILQTQPAIRVLMLSTTATDEQVIEAVRAGARGFLLKDAETEQVIEAIRAVYRGGRVLDPMVAETLMRGIERTAPRSLTEPLTPREVEILRLVAQGLSNREIAAHLHLAAPTVTTHVRNILGKLHLANRTQAAIYARQNGLL
ncbi:MAG: response regulator transcription factor [Anaerolineae bacterium]|nr:response regulator transcription factor [Anaerolineae bacterium]